MTTFPEWDLLPRPDLGNLIVPHRKRNETNSSNAPTEDGQNAACHHQRRLMGFWMDKKNQCLDTKSSHPSRVADSALACLGNWSALSLLKKLVCFVIGGHSFASREKFEFWGAAYFCYTLTVKNVKLERFLFPLLCFACCFLCLWLTCNIKRHPPTPPNPTQHPTVKGMLFFTTTNHKGIMSPQDNATISSTVWPSVSLKTLSCEVSLSSKHLVSRTQDRLILNLPPKKDLRGI